MDNAFMVHGSAGNRIERLLEQALGTSEAERPRQAVPRRPHLPRRPATAATAAATPSHTQRETGK